jgi:hypothetical protein
MPKISNKRALIKRMCEDTALEVLHAPDHEVDRVFDDFLQDFLIVKSMRTTVPRSIVPKSDAWYQSVLPELDDHRFKQFLRMRRQDFAFLLTLIEGHEVFQSRKKVQIPIAKQLAITLYKLGFDGSGSSLANTAALFGIGDGGTVMKVVERVLEVR